MRARGVIGCGIECGHGRRGNGDLGLGSQFDGLKFDSKLGMSQRLVGVSDWVLRICAADRNRRKVRGFNAVQKQN